PTPGGVDFLAINRAKGRVRCRADTPHFDALRDERTGNENCLLNHFFLLFQAPLDWRISKRGAGRDEDRNASSYYTFHSKKITPAASRCKSSEKERARCPLAPQVRAGLALDGCATTTSSQELGPNTRRSDPSHVDPGFRRFRWN